MENQGFHEPHQPPMIYSDDARDDVFRRAHAPNPQSGAGCALFLAVLAFIINPVIGVCALGVACHSKKQYEDGHPDEGSTYKHLSMRCSALAIVLSCCVTGFALVIFIFVINKGVLVLG